MSNTRITADQLPDRQRMALENILKHKAISRIVNDVLANPPSIDLTQVEVVLGKGQKIEDYDVAAQSWTVSGGCETCSAIGGGCETCSAIGGGCETCSAIGG